MLTLQYPDINGKTPTQQIGQIKTYLYQLVSYLQVAQNTMQNAEAVSLQAHVPVTVVGGGQISQEAWNTTKSLIIKSAQIADAFYEKISTRLEGQYVAQSDFGTYTQETAAQLEATSTALTQLYTNLQTLDAQTQQLINTTAYIRSGLLDENEDGSPVYGIEVGQKDTDETGTETFNAYARFTADRLSFFDSYGKELAWVSGYKLYITHVEITGSLVGGGYEVDLSDGWAWVPIGD